MLIVTAALAGIAAAALWGAAASHLGHRVALRTALAVTGTRPGHARREGVGDARRPTERILNVTRVRVRALATLLMPSGYVAAVHRRLALAGRPEPAETDRYLAARVVQLALVPVVALMAFALPVSTRLSVLIALALGLLLALGPGALLSRSIASRQRSIRNQLPDLLDMLTISVEAGLSFEQGLSRTVVETSGPLCDEFARMLHETRLGMGRKEALDRVAERTDVPELRSFLASLNQAETLGISVVQILRSQSIEIRTLRRLRAQEAAQKAPVKMMFPLVFCILPSLFVVIVGPAVIQIYDTVIKPHLL